jgi:hypothetical protein
MPNEDSAAEERARLALSEAQREADRMSSALDDFRQRAATIFTVAVLATTFFAQAIGPDLRSLSWMAILVFVLGVVVPGVIIFMPLKDHFAFGLAPQGILDTREPEETSIMIHEKAATSLSNHLEDTQEKMSPLAILLQVQCCALGLEIILWTVDLAGR